MQNNASIIFNQSGMIMPSHRDLMEYHEYTEIKIEDGRVIALQATQGRVMTTNIPAMNIAFLLLGPGCSISTAAIELLCAANVVIGFCGADGTPLSGSTEVSFLTSRSEYGPTEYQQAWGRMWYDEDRRNRTAAEALNVRFKAMEHFWAKLDMDIYTEDLFKYASGNSKCSSAERYAKTIIGSRLSSPELLGVEGAHVKKLYQFFCHKHDIKHTRDDKGPVDSLLKQGNYIAYGAAATALRALNIEFSYPLLHGKTRRGALAFDIADIIKDAIIVPTAFAWRNCSHDEYRRKLKQELTKHHVLSYLINAIKDLSETK